MQYTNTLQYSKNNECHELSEEIMFFSAPIILNDTILFLWARFYSSERKKKTLQTAVCI